MTPLELAKIKVTPGVVAVAVCWFKGAPVAGPLRVTTLVWLPEATLCQVNGPTEGVMSVEPLMAKAW